MGCVCAKDREKEEQKSQEDPPLLVTRRKSTLKRSKSMHSKVAFEGEIATHTPEIVRRLKEPIESLYQFSDVVAQTAKSVLFRAEFLGTKQVCYLKSVKKQLGRLQIQQKAKLSAEADRLSRLDHPYILRLYEVLQDNKQFYLAYESFLGGNLLKFAEERKTVTENFLAKAFHQVFRALSYCHLRGIVHGNLTPRSIVLATESEEPTVKLIGFGTCDEFPCEDSPENQNAFRAPEMADGYNEKCDIWSCGAVLYFLLSGEFPFPSNPTAARKKKQPLCFSSQAWEGKSREVMSLITCMLDPNPHNRPSASQCRYHPWIRLHLRLHSVKMTAANAYLFNLRKLRRRNALQQAVLRFVVIRILREAEGMVEAFLMLDRDGDGIINEEELLQGFMRISSEDEAVSSTQKVMETLEQNGSSAISFTEFLISSFGEKKLLSAANLKTVFRCFDRSNSGLVRLHDFRTLFAVKDSVGRERQWRELLLHADCDGEEQIDFGKFTALMANVNPA